MRKTTTVLFAVFTAAMVACGGGSPTAGPGVPTSTTAPVESTTTAPTLTTLPGPTTSVAPTTVASGSACPVRPLPAGATAVSSAAGRFDGDGKPDTLQAYQDGGTWHLRTQLSAGGNMDVTVANVGAGEAVKAVGGFNIDGDLTDEVFATVGSGAYTTLVGLWKVTGCQLARLTVKGELATFPVGASALNRVGLRCVAGTAIQALETQGNSSGTVFTGSLGNYDVVGNTLVLANSSPPQVLAATDPDLVPYGKLTCGALSLP